MPTYKINYTPNTRDNEADILTELNKIEHIIRGDIRSEYTIEFIVDNGNASAETITISTAILNKIKEIQEIYLYNNKHSCKVTFDFTNCPSIATIQTESTLEDMDLKNLCIKGASNLTKFPKKLALILSI